MEDEIIIHRQIINHYSRPDLAPQLWNYSSTLANNNNGLYWVAWRERGRKKREAERGGEEEQHGKTELAQQCGTPESRVIIIVLGPSIVEPNPAEPNSIHLD